MKKYIHDNTNIYDNILRNEAFIYSFYSRVNFLDYSSFLFLQCSYLFISIE